MLPFLSFVLPFIAAEDATLFVKMTALLKLDGRKFVIDNKEHIMNSLLEVEDFEQVFCRYSLKLFFV